MTDDGGDEPITTGQRALRELEQLATGSTISMPAAAASGDAGGTLDLPESDQVAAAGALDPGGLIGRFVIRSRLGEGGMGIVLAGHDADLGRPVAIKVVKEAGDHPAYRARLLREAQVMARLEHPNVVRVYEVGTDRGRLYVAMQLVDGVNLAAWLALERRRWRDILAMFAQVGRGLAAVHAAGLVHRDFKPDNVLVDRDGRARVADFGLARIDPDRTTASPELAASLTRTGMLVGTPAYMAPEQQFGGDVDARADQYSFCIALREALIGHRPIKITDEHWRGIPRAVRAAIDRGASIDASQRWPSMDELLRALDRGASRRGLYLAAGAAGIVVAAGIVAIVAVASSPGEGGTSARDITASAAQSTRTAGTEDGEDTRGNGTRGGGSDLDGTGGDGTRGDGTRGDGTGGDTRGGGSAGDTRADDDATGGDDARRDGTQGDGTRGDGTRGDGTHGDGTRGDVMRDDTRGDGMRGDGTPGDGTRGDGTGDDARGDGTRGAGTRVDGTRGDTRVDGTRGDNSRNETRGGDSRADTRADGSRGDTRGGGSRTDAARGDPRSTTRTTSRSHAGTPAGARGDRQVPASGGGATTVGNTVVTPMAPLPATDAAKRHNLDGGKPKAHEMVAAHRGIVRAAVREFGFGGVTITGDDREADLRDVQAKLDASTDDLERGVLRYAMGQLERLRDDCGAAGRHWRDAKKLVLAATRGPIDSTQKEKRREQGFRFYGRIVIADAYCDLLTGRALGVHDKLLTGVRNLFGVGDGERAEAWFAMGIALVETGDAEQGRQLLLQAGRRGGSDKLRQAITAYADAVGVKL